MDEVSGTSVIVPLTKEECLNKIIAAGANALGKKVNASEEENQLLERFVKEAFDVIIPCWDNLDDKVRFKIFQAHLTDFKEYMKISQDKQ